MICFPNKTDCRKQCESSREKVWNDPADTCPLMRARIKIPYMQVDTCIVDGKSDEAISRGAHMTKMVSNPNRMPEKTELVLFKDGEINLEVPVIPEEETVWLNQAQMVELYGRDTSVISRHIRNIFKEGELDKESNLHFLQIANSDRPVAFYSLDVIISVGYRVKSHRGIAFRKWANGVLKQYILRGYAVNENRMKQLGEVVRLMKRTQESLDSIKYGDPLGPTYEMLREKKTCKQIIESASRPIEDLDNRFTLDGFQQWYKTYKNLQSN